MNVFVSKQDRVEVAVFFGEVDGKTAASTNQTEAPKEHGSCTFVFRKPNYRDSTTIMSRAQISSNETNVISFQDELIKSLLVKMVVDGKDVEASAAAINDLDPVIARTAVGGLLDKIAI